MPGRLHCGYVTGTQKVTDNENKLQPKWKKGYMRERKEGKLEKNKSREESSD